MNARVWLCLFLTVGAAGCVTAASGQRDALEAARIEWLRRGTPLQPGCTPQLRPLTSFAFQASCGVTVTYVRCTYGGSKTCCATMPDQASAIETLHLETYHDAPATRVCD